MPNIRSGSGSLNIAGVYDDVGRMLEELSPDVVSICTPAGCHREQAVAALRSGAHVLCEKPLTISSADAEKIFRVAEESGRHMLVGQSMRFYNQVSAAKELIDSGAIGHLVEINYRVGHSGPYGPGASHKGVSESAEPLTEKERAAIWLHQEAAGGGAMIDLCCYGVMYGLWYTGEKAVSAQGIKANIDSKWCDADDNGVMVVRFPSAIAVAQGSWTTLGKTFLTAGPLMLFGAKGALSFEIYGEKPVVQLTRGANHEVEIFEAEPLPEGRDNLAAEFIHHLETGEPVHETLAVEFNLDMTAAFDAGLRSAESGNLIKLNETKYSQIYREITENN